MTVKPITIDPAHYEGLEGEVDWNFDDEEVNTQHKAIAETNPELAKILKKHADKEATKAD